MGQPWLFNVALTISLLRQSQIQFHTFEGYPKYMQYTSCLLDQFYEAKHTMMSHTNSYCRISTTYYRLL